MSFDQKLHRNYLCWSQGQNRRTRQPLTAWMEILNRGRRSSLITEGHRIWQVCVGLQEEDMREHECLCVRVTTCACVGVCVGVCTHTCTYVHVFELLCFVLSPYQGVYAKFVPDFICLSSCSSESPKKLIFPGDFLFSIAAKEYLN